MTLPRDSNAMPTQCSESAVALDFTTSSITEHPPSRRHCQKLDDEILGQCPRKTVRFSDQIDTIDADLDPKLRKFKWYRKKDYHAFQEDRKETLRHFRERQAGFQSIDERLYCLRGFEAFLSARSLQQKAMRRLAAIETVMGLQLRQRRRGIHEPKKIHSEYYRVTAASRLQAQERAAMDALEVETGSEMKNLKTDFNHLILKTQGSTSMVPTLRSGGPLRLCKTVPSTA